MIAMAILAGLLGAAVFLGRFCACQDRVSVRDPRTGCGLDPERDQF